MYGRCSEAAEHPARTGPLPPPADSAQNPCSLAARALRGRFSPWIVRSPEAEAASRMALPSSHAALGLRILPTTRTPGERGIRRH